jgi:hypothetical protein
VLCCAVLPYRYDSQSGPYETAVAVAIADYKKVQRVESKLKPVKVFAALAGVLSLSMGLKALSRNSPSAIVYAIAGFDLFVLSYNCYIKKYCAVAGKQYFNKVGDKVTWWIKDTLGLNSDKKEKADPAVLLNGDIVWDMLLEGTITQAAMTQVKAAIK